MPGTRLDQTAIPIRIATGDLVTLTLFISGPATSTVSWAMTSGGGVFSPSSGMVATTSDGKGVITLSYTAPTFPGDLAHILALDAEQTNFSFETHIRQLVPTGEYVPFQDNAGLVVNANLLHGQQIFVNSETFVMRLGLVAQAGGYTGRLALYSNVGGLPGNYIVGTSLAVIVPGPNEQSVIPTLLTQGTYWLLANFSMTAPIKRSSTVSTGQAFAVLPSGEPFPAVVSATAATNLTLNYYMQVVP